jgi:hypothetical protein
MQVEAQISRQEILTISDGASEFTIVPELGAGLAWYDLLIGGKSAPIFRPCRNPSARGRGL